VTVIRRATTEGIVGPHTDELTGASTLQFQSDAELGTRHLSGAAVRDPHLRTGLVSVGELARCRVGGCLEATVAVLVEGKLTTLAATEPFVVDLDSFQYETGEGPCIDAVRTRGTVEADLLVDRPRYPRFAPQALMAGVVRVLSEPLESEGTLLGSLNLFALTSSALDDALRPTRLLATQASACVRAALTREELRRNVAQMEQALESRDVIGQAKGILMQQGGIGADEAFRLLVRASQRENRKLREVAQRIADRAGHQVGDGGPSPGAAR
jgi:hypothetical protein